MDTKTCPYCGGEIMSAAKKCKHCGEWLEARPQNSSNEHREPQPNSQGTDVEIKHSNTKKIIIIVVCVIILALVITDLIISNQKSDWEKAMEEYDSESSYTEEVVETEPYYEGNYYNSGNSDDDYPVNSADAWK